MSKLEHMVRDLLKDVPHLPLVWRKWLAENVWWVALAGAIISGASALFGLIGLLSRLSVIGTIEATFYASAAVLTWEIIKSAISFAFSLVSALLLGSSVTPLKERQKKGWVLLFGAWLVSGISIIINSLLSLNIIVFALSIMFGAVFLAATGYALFEMHGQFANVVKSEGVKKGKAKSGTGAKSEAEAGADDK